MMWELTSALAGSLLFFAPVSDNFANKGNAPLGSYDTGQPRFTYATPYNVNAELRIVNGKLTNTSTVGSAGYSHANIGTQVSSIGGTFVLQPGSGGKYGCAAFLIWNWLPQHDTDPAESAFHMSIASSGWQLISYKLDNPPTLASSPQTPRETQIASGTFSPPLPNDGKTLLSFSADINAAAGTATLHLPDGTTQTVGPTPTISASPGIGNYPGWEVYQQSSTDDRAAFITLFANQ